MNEITNNVEKFYQSINSIPDHRYKSWEHCYNFFKKIKDKEIDKEELDLAQLHLAFYLASWGMYRGSSFILQKDYTIFKEIVGIILKKEYSILWEIEDNLNKSEDLIEKFSKIYKEIENVLIKIKETTKNHPDLEGTKKRYLQGNQISYTLITKILLGTMGCIPAYDRFFMEGLSDEKKIRKNFNKNKSFEELLGFYDKYKKDINELRGDLKEKYNAGDYTPMKIIDMYFWQIGEEKDSLKIKIS